jgi:TPP-dependent pyruvate/acetoin dehydrogenase alpha subunit
MGGHYSTRNLNDDGTWKNLMEKKNSSADISPTAGQMPRLLGLAQASKVYRENKELHGFTQFTDKGNEVAFGTIGDASTSEGLFWETVNAATVLQVPMALSVWDDGYGISVPKKYQTAKESISQALSGFDVTDDGLKGLKIYKVKGWNYPELIATYEEAISYCREKHGPVLIHVEEVTQPQGHSTSGSHERYKSKERLEWAKEYDCNVKFREFILMEGAASEDELEEIEKESKKFVRQEQKEAWKNFTNPIKKELSEAVELINKLAANSDNKAFVEKVGKELKSAMDPIRKDVFNAVRKVIRLTRKEELAEKETLIAWLQKRLEENRTRYSSHLYSESEQRVLNIEPIAAEYPDEPEEVDGRIVLKKNFEKKVWNQGK